jgi:hypothetical protein
VARDAGFAAVEAAGGLNGDGCASRGVAGSPENSATWRKANAAADAPTGALARLGRLR